MFRSRKHPYIFFECYKIWTETASLIWTFFSLFSAREAGGYLLDDGTVENMWEVGEGRINRQMEEISETRVSDRLS